VFDPFGVRGYRLRVEAEQAALHVDTGLAATFELGPDRDVVRPFWSSRVLQLSECLSKKGFQDRTVLGHGLGLLAGTAVRLRDSFDISDAVWSLIGFLAHGRLLALPRPLRS
jgi:hypothetical protein